MSWLSIIKSKFDMRIVTFHGKLPAVAPTFLVRVSDLVKGP